MDFLDEEFEVDFSFQNCLVSDYWSGWSGFLLGIIGTIVTFEDFGSVRAHTIPKLVDFAAPTQHPTLEIIEVCSMSSNTSGGR